MANIIPPDLNLHEFNKIVIFEKIDKIAKIPNNIEEKGRNC